MRFWGAKVFKTSSSSGSVVHIGAFNSNRASQMRPDVKHRRLDSGVAAVQVSGELDLASVGRLEASVEHALAQDPAPLLVDFTECGFIDSTVLSVLVGLGRRPADSAPPRFAVVARGQPLSVLGVAGLDQMMPVYPSLAEALR